MFKNPFSFEGRIRRTEYGLSLIIATAGRVLISFILSGVSRDAVFIVNLIFQAPLLWFIWAQGAKRCHDVNMSGWYQAIPIFPLYMIFASGDEENNKYGENPKLRTEIF